LSHSNEGFLCYIYSMITIEDFQDYFLEFTDVHPYILPPDDYEGVFGNFIDKSVCRMHIVDNIHLQKAFRQRTNIYINTSIYEFIQKFLSYGEINEDNIKKYCKRLHSEYYYEGYIIELYPKVDDELSEKEKKDIITSLIKTVKQVSRRTGMLGYIMTYNGSLDKTSLRRIGRYSISIIFIETE